jgi:RNA polymerase sigma factor (sigma-70 family)
VTPWALISPARLAGTGLLRTQSDTRLVDLVRAGNDRAFEAIVLRYHRQLLRHCRRLLPAGRAEDAVQQTLLRALEAMRADERELQLGPWLHRIAHNTAIDALRRLDSHWEELDERMDGVEPPDAAVERRARFSSVVASMGALPERQRRALVLRELEGRSYEEISAALGVSGAGVRQLLNRARNAMRAAAGTVVPPALLGRIAGSQAGIRVAELADPPGTSALLARATAAVAAGAVALVAVSGTSSSDLGRPPHAAAGTGPPAVEARPHAGWRLDPEATPAGVDLGARSSAASTTRPGPRGGGPAHVRRESVRAGASPGGGLAGRPLDEGSAPGSLATPSGDREAGDAHDAPGSPTPAHQDDADDDAQPDTGDSPDDGVVAVTAPLDDDGAADVDGPSPAGAPGAETQAALPDDDGDDPGELE